MALQVVCNWPQVAVILVEYACRLVHQAQRHIIKHSACTGCTNSPSTDKEQMACCQGIVGMAPSLSSSTILALILLQIYPSAAVLTTLAPSV